MLGLADFRRDAYAAAVHAEEVQRAYPHAEIGFSVPRLRPILGGRAPLAAASAQPGFVVPESEVHEAELLSLIHI